LKRPQVPLRTQAVLDSRTSAHRREPPEGRTRLKRHRLPCIASRRTRSRQTVKLTPRSSEAETPYVVDIQTVRPSKQNQTARISLHQISGSMSDRDAWSRLPMLGVAPWRFRVPAAASSGARRCGGGGYRDRLGGAQAEKTRAPRFSPPAQRSVSGALRPRNLRSRRPLSSARKDR
jgi:hypothetical protein